MNQREERGSEVSEDTFYDCIIVGGGPDGEVKSNEEGVNAIPSSDSA
jgi:hypothetical protein